MITPTRSQQLSWMSQWRSAAVALARVKAEELAAVDLVRVALPVISSRGERLRQRLAMVEGLDERVGNAVLSRIPS